MKNKEIFVLSFLVVCLCSSLLIMNKVRFSSSFGALFEYDTEALSIWECVNTGGEFLGVCCDLHDGTGKMCIDLPGYVQPRDCTSQIYFND